MLTITEGLAEIKTLKARIEKKRQGIGPYIVRPAQMRDPMEKDGGVAWACDVCDVDADDNAFEVPL